jgi:hypothetical protein
MNQIPIVISHTEKEIKNDLNKKRSSDNGSNLSGTDDFVVRQDEQKWVIEFLKRNMQGELDRNLIYTLAAKRGGVRKFARLSGVLAWMKKMGIREFKVVLPI